MFIQNPDVYYLETTNIRKRFMYVTIVAWSYFALFFVCVATYRENWQVDYLLKLVDRSYANDSWPNRAYYPVLDEHVVAVTRDCPQSPYTDYPEKVTPIEWKFLGTKSFSTQDLEDGPVTVKELFDYLVVKA